MKPPTSLQFSDVYQSEQVMDSSSRHSKFVICLMYLLTIASAMSFLSQGFFWGFALFLLIPIEFQMMRVLLKFQGSSEKAGRNGTICMIVSIVMIFLLLTVFIYSYMITYGTYFSQKYSSKWCRAVAENPSTTTQLPGYSSVVYQVLNSKDEPTTANSETAVFGCGCKFADQQSMSVNGVSGYQYVFTNSGGLANLPFWICNNQVVQMNSQVNKCYVYTRGNPTAAALNSMDICENSNSFIQVSMDSIPYFSAKLFLYLIGLFLITLFGCACYFPMGYTLLKFNNRGCRVVQPEERPFERRKLYMWKALQKVLVEEKKQREEESMIINGQEGRMIWREEIIEEIFQLIQVPHFQKRFQLKKQATQINIQSQPLQIELILGNQPEQQEGLEHDQSIHASRQVEGVPRSELRIDVQQEEELNISQRNYAAEKSDEEQDYNNYEAKEDIIIDVEAVADLFATRNNAIEINIENPQEQPQRTRVQSCFVLPPSQLNNEDEDDSSRARSYTTDRQQ